MKSLAIWTTGVIVAFAALAGVTTATRDTEQVFVVVDTSFEMLGKEARVTAELDRIDDREYAEFALATVARRSGEVHGYQDEFDWVSVEPAGPCSFDDLASFAEASSADERILITSVFARDAPSCSTSELSDWTIIEIDG